MQTIRAGRKDTLEEKNLRKKARELGLKIHPRMGAPRLKEMINQHLQTLMEAPQEPLSDTGMQMLRKALPTPQNGSEEPEYMTQEEFEQKQFAEDKRNAGRLVRIRLTCMNPTKKNWTGEIISVGSAKLGTYKKFIPFNMEEPYHVPWIIYKYLKERQCRIGTVTKLPDGREINRYKLINEFSIDLLPPLTKEELHQLKQRQAMANGQT